MVTELNRVELLRSVIVRVIYKIGRLPSWSPDLFNHELDDKNFSKNLSSACAMARIVQLYCPINVETRTAYSQ